jgi:branched-chain amino acid aminotransferase
MTNFDGHIMEMSSMVEIAFLNGRFLPLNEASVPVSDSGFLYGYGCYETLRGYQGHFFRFDDHLNRLSQTADKLRLPVDMQALRKVVPETLRRNDFENSRVRITITGGEGNLNSASQTLQNPTVLVTVTNYEPNSFEKYKKGFQVIFARSTRNSGSLLPGLKTTCFLESLLARRQALSTGADDALLLNENGLLTEASSSNVFIFSEGILKTPRLGIGLLPGVTRRILLDLAKQNDISAVEADILPEELMNTGEVFLTNSMLEIMPVTGLEGKAVGSAKPGPVTRKLMAAYKELVAQEIKNS